MTVEAEDIEDLETADALEAIRHALTVNSEAPRGTPDVLHLKDLRTMISVFQPRDLTYREGEDAAHLDVLTKAIGNSERPHYLEPITIWWGGDRWYIVDGHHRRIAYQNAKVKSGIPVRVFSGTLEEAIVQSVSLNSKNKMPMSLQDKMNMAWKLTTCTEFSKNRIAVECSIAESSVANMRRVKRELLASGWTSDRALGVTWLEAQFQAKGDERPEVDHDEAADRRAQGYAKAIARALKDRPHRDPEGFARALLLLDDRLPGRLLETEAWSDVLSSYRQEGSDASAGDDDY